MSEIKNLKYYVNLPYTIVLRRDDDGDIVARVEELPGCSDHGATQDEALRNLEEAKRLWISHRLKAGQSVPEPEPEEDLPSGKWVQRVPRTLHKRLALTAKREEVSLNQLVTSMLSEALATRVSTARGGFGAPVRTRVPSNRSLP
jgi:antitoxin HicB